MIRLTGLALLLAAPVYIAAQQADANYDESKVPQYSLPAALTLKNGKPVRDARTWSRQRREEILELYRSEVYGRSPAKPSRLIHEASTADTKALGGKAVRKQVTIYFTGSKKAPKMDVLLYLPAAAGKPVPVFVSLGFSGNQSVHTDPGIPLAEQWVRDPETKEMVKRPAPETARGAMASRWQLEKILEHGYGLATVYAGDIEPDFDGGMKYGIRPLFFRAGQTAPEPDEWGALAAWAWGLSRVADYLETDRDVDARRIALLGHSRMGKAALWAAAQDPRFSLVISNESGEGGAALSRRLFGERVRNLNTNFPYWFCGNFKNYNDREEELPVDSHMLLALIAPRPLYVASAEEDRWSDPRGEFLAAFHASQVYELLGRRGLGTDQMPAVNQPIMHDVAYHVRTGKHDITNFDWDQYLKFADTHWKK